MGDEPECKLPVWEEQEDGSVKIHFPEAFIKNLADDLNKWESFSHWLDREDCKNWKRSPIARENRRESVVLGNCAETVISAFGRRSMNTFMKKCAQELEQMDKARGEGKP